MFTRAQQPVVSQPPHDPVLVLGEPPPRRLHRGRSTTRGAVETDPDPLGLVRLVQRGPVLPAVALSERPAIDHP